MRHQRINVRSLVLALVAAAGTATSAGAAAPELKVANGRGSSVLTLGGRTLHTTTSSIANPKLLTLRDSSTVIGLWEEANSAKVVESYYGLSLDGGRSFAVVMPNPKMVRLVYSTFDPLQGEPVVAPELAASAESQVYMVQFVIPPVDEFRRDVTQLGGTIERFLTDHTHVVTMDAATAAKVRALPYVRWVGKYHPAYRLSADIRESLAAGSMDFGAQRYSIECFRGGPVQQQKVSDAIRKMGGIVEVNTWDGYRMEATMTAQQLLAVAAMNEVNYIDPWGGPGGTDMNVIRQLHGATTDANGTAIGGYSGQGVRGEVFDTEVRVGHAAFQSPPVLLHGGSAGNAGDPHGSSVYGINFADWPGNPTYNGVVTSAEQGIFFAYPLCTQFGGTITRLIANTEATSPTGPYKSSYQTSSIGSAQGTAYTTISAEVDDYLLKVDYLSCQSQSNTGTLQSRPQAWAKNIVSVGGLEWHGTLARGDDNWSGASFGPASDGRVKPELTSCYADIPTTDNSGNTGTTSFGGTSGATPITAGCFGILNQMWHEGVFAGFGGGSSVFADRPRAMTAKALMCNTAFRYPLNQGGLTRAKQGWGMADLTNLYNLRSKTFIINETVPIQSGQVKSFTVCVAQGEPVASFTLSYIDPMGNPAATQARINDLNLRVKSPSGLFYRGNNALVTSNFSTVAGVFSSVDTLENVFVQNPEPGQWTIDVIGASIVQDAYPATPGVNDVPFALVSTGTPPLVPVMSVMGGAPSMLSPTVATAARVRITNGCQSVLAGSETLVYRSGPGKPFINIPLASLGGGEYSVAFPLPLCTDVPQYFFTCAGDQGAVVTLPVNAPTTLFSSTVGDIEVRFSDDFESDKGWSSSVPSDNATTGRWGRNNPQATEAQPGADHSDQGTLCWCTDYRAGQQVSDYDVDGGKTTLTSPLLDASNLNEATITYYRWYSNAVGPINPNTNVFTVEISNNDGDSWVTLETVGPAGPDTEPGWKEHTVKIANILPPTATMRVRFIASDITDSIVEAAIDDFSIHGIRCDLPCYANCDGSSGSPVLTGNDFQCFLNRYIAGDTWANCDGSAGSPVLTPNDFQCFLNSYVAGCH